MFLSYSEEKYTLHAHAHTHTHNFKLLFTLTLGIQDGEADGIDTNGA